MQLTSTAFRDHGPIPKVHTGEGRDRSPPLAIAEVPAEAKSLALIVDDPDAPDPAAPKRTWVHWIMYNLPPNTRVLDEGVSRAPAPGRDGRNDWDDAGYGGPRPPVGRHRYFHKLYALDVVLPDLGTPNKATLEKAMQGHVIAETELVGTYEKGGN